MTRIDIRPEWMSRGCNVARDVPLGRHRGVANYLYGDAHVEAIAVEQILDWTSPSEVFNFAEPQDGRAVRRIR